MVGHYVSARACRLRDAGTGSAAVAVAPLAEFGALKDGKARVIWAPKMN